MSNLEQQTPDSEHLSAIQLKTNGLNLFRNPLPIKSIKLSGFINENNASITYTLTFAADKEDEGRNLEKESIFQLVLPDFGAVVDYNAQINEDLIETQVIDSKSNGCILNRKLSVLDSIKGPGQLIFAVIAQNLNVSDRLQINFTIETHLLFDSKNFHLVLPVLLLPFDTAGPRKKDSTLKTSSEKIDFFINLQFSSKWNVENIYSPTHPIVTYFKPSEPKFKCSIITQDPQSSTPVSATDNFVLTFTSPNSIEDHFPNTTISQVDRYHHERLNFDKIAMFSFKPKLSPQICSSEILLVFDTANMPHEIFPKALKSILKQELSNLNDIFVNLVLLTKSGPQFALPKSSTITPDILQKLCNTIEIWESLVKKQGIRSSNPSNDLAVYLNTILQRTQPIPNLPRNLILISNLRTPKNIALDRILAILDEQTTVFPVGVGNAANFFVLQSLAQATNGRLECAWEIETFSTKLSDQIARALQPKLLNVTLECDDESVIVSPNPHPPFYSGDVIHFYAFFDQKAKKKSHFQLYAEWYLSHGKSSPISLNPNKSFIEVDLIDDSKKVDRYSTPTHPCFESIAANERIFDLELFACASNYESQDKAACTIDPEILSAIHQLVIPLRLVTPFSALQGSRARISDEVGNTQDNKLRSADIIAYYREMSSDLENQYFDDPNSTESNDRLIYDFDTMLSFKSFADRPSDLPLIPGVTIDSNQRSSPLKDSRSGSRGELRDSRGNGTPRKKASQSKPSEKKRPVLSIQGVWADANVGDVQAIKSSEHYLLWFKNMNSTLNKLTQDNFDRLSAKILQELESEVDDAYAVKGFIDLLYDKTIRQVKYSTMYADLVRLLIDSQKSTEATDQIRRSLLDRCRLEFEKAMLTKTLLLEREEKERIEKEKIAKEKLEKEKLERQKLETETVPAGSASPQPTRPRFFNLAGSSSTLRGSTDSLGRNSSSSIQEDEEEKENKLREYRVGLVTFLGKLFKKGIINTDITQTCIAELLSKSAEYQDKDKIKSSECLSLASTYIDVVGKKLEEISPNVVEKLFILINQDIIENQDIEPRIRYLFVNLVELKKNNWVPRDRQAEIAPQTLGDLRKSYNSPRKLGPH